MKVRIELDLTPQEAHELLSGSAASAAQFQQQFFEAVTQELARQLMQQWEYWPAPPWPPYGGNSSGSPS